MEVALGQKTQARRRGIERGGAKTTRGEKIQKKRVENNALFAQRSKS
jgi:hypothetical protein